VLDLRTSELRQGLPEDYIRTAAPTVWKGLHEPCPRWEQFVSEVMNDEVDRVNFLQRILGYSLNGTTTEHVLVILVGPRGRNGKGTLCETVLQVMGKYAATVSTDVVVGNDRWRSPGSAQPHLRDLMGKRFATCSETEGDGNAHLTVAQVKNVTGGDTIKARRLHENLVEFAPSHTLFLQTNRKPHAPADDDALWERVKVIEFRTRFIDNPQESDERPRDPDLGKKLTQEHSGILAWIVRGHHGWQNHGLQTPDSVKLARDTYRKEESIVPFLDACCYEDVSVKSESTALYEAYKRWCASRGYRIQTQRWFGEQLRDRYERGRDDVTRRVCYHGIGLLPDDGWGADNAPPPDGSGSPLSEDDNIPQRFRGASESQIDTTNDEVPKPLRSNPNSFGYDGLVKEDFLGNGFEGFEGFDNASDAFDKPAAEQPYADAALGDHTQPVPAEEQHRCSESPDAAPPPPDGGAGALTPPSSAGLDDAAPAPTPDTPRKPARTSPRVLSRSDGRHCVDVGLTKPDASADAAEVATALDASGIPAGWDWDSSQSYTLVHTESGQRTRIDASKERVIVEALSIALDWPTARAHAAYEAYQQQRRE
jgi:P4 family phage/plasmid primase-like protien